jgi:hypothetical protein
LDKRQDMTRRGAVDANGNDVWSGVEQARTLLDWLAVAGMGIVAAGEADVSGEVRVQR